MRRETRMRLRQSDFGSSSSVSSVVVPSKKKKTNKRRIDSEDDGGNAQNTQAQPSVRAQSSAQVQQPVRAQPSVQAQPSARAQPSTSAGPSNSQTIPRAPRRMELHTWDQQTIHMFKKEVPSRKVLNFRAPVPSRSEDQTRREFATSKRQELTFSMQTFKRTIRIGRSPSYPGTQ